MIVELGLIADVGATNARFAMADPNGIYDEKILKCADYAGIDLAAKDYLHMVGANGAGKAPSKASFAMAGPVQDDFFKMTNHPWSFNIEEVRKALALSSLHIMNDFHAIALSVPHLRPEDIRQLGGGDAVHGAAIGIIGPGTGLGVSSLFWDGQAYRPNPCEGGHVTMPARTQREFDVLRYLRHKYRHVSAERVCSGKGLVNVYNALRALDARQDLAERTPEQISANAISGQCDICREALTMMVLFLGRVAGNLALTLNAKGGMYIAGGIISQLGAYFYDSDFRTEFISKGRFETYLDTIPTYVIENPLVAFTGLHADLFAQQSY